MSIQKAPISFIIPSYNRAQSLSGAIQSVIDQIDQHWELIVVDDGSTDNTRKVVRDFLADSRIKYLYQENLGVSAARNNGVTLAEGDYIIFLDSDDKIGTGLLNSLKEANYKEYDLICWQICRKTDNKTFIQKPANLGKMYNGITATFLAGSVCYDKNLFLKVGGYDQKMTFGENYELGLRICDLAHLKIKILDKPFLRYYINTFNRPSNSIDNRLVSHLHQFEKHRKKYEKDRKARSVMKYLIGYTLEKSGNKTAALQWYKKSWQSQPWSLKPMLKFIYLNIF